MNTGAQNPGKPASPKNTANTTPKQRFRSNTKIQYAELHCLSNFSFLRSASHPEELVHTAQELGYQAIAITDECSFAGVVKAHVAAKEANIKLIIGSEFYTDCGAHCIALANTKQAYSEISALITLARRRSEKGRYHVRLQDLIHNLRQTLLIYKPRYESTLNKEADTSECHDNNRLALLSPHFEQRLWLGISLLYRNQEAPYYRHCVNLSRSFGIPLLASGEVLMHSRKRKPLHDLLTAIDHNTQVQNLGEALCSNAQNHLRPLHKLARCYPKPLLTETLVVAQQCSFSLDELRYNYPEEVVPPSMSPGDYLQHLVSDGATKRWPSGTPEKMQAQINHELGLIREMRYEYYFLTVYDIVQFARERQILCQGRGSAANSVVCYCLGITEVQPDKLDLLFERFISKERNEPPDIDVDFEHERREEVIQYIYKKYSRERAALTATLICYRPRSAIRDVGKAIGLDQLFIDQLGRSLAWWDRKADLQRRFDSQGIDRGGQLARQFFYFIQAIQGFPRHLSQHVGGFIITNDAVSSLVPVENASMTDRTVIQWDKESIEALGLLKVDVLALGMLSAIRKTLALIKLDIADIPAEDPETYAMLQNADSVGVFQVESRAQMSMLPRLRPENFYDLVVQVAIVRPGPIQGNMVHPYLRRRQGLEPIHYHSEDIKHVLERTMGVPIFQEQVIKLAMVAAGFSGGEADQLRRAMASWGKNGNLLQFESKLKDGMRERGYSEQFAEDLFNQMKGFGAYGFPESHAASFALLVYISAWLKRHHPAAFYCGLLNSLPMGFYSPSQLVQDAKRHAIVVLPIDINHSSWDHQLEALNTSDIENGKPTSKALRLGMRLLKGLDQADADAICAVRKDKPFTSISELQQRCAVPQEAMEILAAAGALHGLENNRYQAHWQNLGIEQPLALIAEDKPSFITTNLGPNQDQNQEKSNSDSLMLEAPSEVDCMNADYYYSGLSLGRHPMELLREQHDWIAAMPRSKDLPSWGNRRFVRFMGLVTGRQRPGSASGVVFLTLEDQDGNTNVIVWKDVQNRYREALLKGKLLQIQGVVEHNDGVTHVIAGKLLDRSEHLDVLKLKSRDFH